MGGVYKVRERSSPYVRNYKKWNTPIKEENSPVGVGGVESGISTPCQEPPQADTREASLSDTPTPRRKEKKCTVKSRLFIGNLPRDTKDTQVKEMFEEFGEVIEIFVQKEKGFGFVRMVSYYVLRRFNHWKMCGVVVLIREGSKPHWESC